MPASRSAPTPTPVATPTPDPSSRLPSASSPSTGGFREAGLQGEARSSGAYRPVPGKHSHPTDEPSPWVARGIMLAAALTLAAVVYIFLGQGDEPVPMKPSPTIVDVRSPDPSVADRSKPSRRLERPLGPAGGSGAVRPGSAGQAVTASDFGRSRHVPPPGGRRPATDPVEGPVSVDQVGEITMYDRPYETYDTIDETPYILVFSRPAGLKVFLDGSLAGRTPLLRRRPPDVSRLRIRIEGPGYVPVEQTVTPDRYGHLRMGVEMKRRP